MRRAGGHAGAGMGTCVLLVPGTVADQERLKRTEPARGVRCPRFSGQGSIRMLIRKGTGSSAGKREEILS